MGTAQPTVIGSIYKALAKCDSITFRRGDGVDCSVSVKLIKSVDDEIFVSERFFDMRLIEMVAYKDQFTAGEIDLALETFLVGLHSPCPTP